MRLGRLRLPVVAVGAAIVLAALVAPLLPLPDPVRMDVAHRLAGASLVHWLGRDELGRDELSRLLWGGARVAGRRVLPRRHSPASPAPRSACSAASCAGSPSCWRCARWMCVLCFPPLLLALLVVTLIGPGAATLIPLLAVLFLPGFVRVAYAGVLQVAAQDYVEAVRALGASRLRIMARTVLPNVGGPVLVQFSLAVAAAVVLESGLSFLGLGVVPPAPSWGLMIGAARATMAQDAVAAAVAVRGARALTILAMNALCDALRDAVDPHAAPAARAAAVAARPLTTPRIAGPVLAIEGLTMEIDTPRWPHPPGARRVLARGRGRDAGDRGRERIGQIADRSRRDGPAAACRARRRRSGVARRHRTAASA